MIGKRIVFARKKMGISQKSLAIQINTSPVVVCGYEKGRRGNKRPNLELIKKIALTLNVSVEWILSDEEDENKKNNAVIDKRIAYSVY